MEGILPFRCCVWPGEGKVFAHSNRSGSAIAGLCLLIILIGTACNHDDPGGGVIPTSPVIGGRIDGTPDVDGAWEFTLSPGTDSCGIEFFPVTPAGVFQVTQVNTDTAFGVINECGTVVAPGKGTSDPSGIVTFVWEEIYQASATCFLMLTTAATGTIDTPGQMITGSYTTDVEPRDNSQDCSTTFPCSLSGAFTATSCPPATCEFSVCGI